MTSEVNCSFSRLIYPSDSIVSALVVFTPNERLLKHYNFTNVEFQACGHVTIDNRWAKLKNLNSYYDESVINQIDNLEHQPSFLIRKATTNTFSSIIFQTKSEMMSFHEFMNNSGVIIQFHLPDQLLCCCKGLSLSVQYNLTVQFVNLEGDRQHVLFPFQVLSNGSSQSPYITRISEITVFPLETLTSYTNPQFALHEPDIADHDYGFEDIYQYRSKLYNICHHDKLLCVLEIASLFSVRDAMISFPGNTIPLKFHFNTSQVLCSSIRVSLLQMEERCNGTKVQDQIINTICRSSIDALYIQSKLHIAENIPCTCDAPTAKISYAIQIEILSDPNIISSKNEVMIPSTPRGSLASPSMDGFQQDGAVAVLKVKRHNSISNLDRESDNPEDPFLLILPLKIVIPPQVLNETWSIYEEALNCLEPAVTLTQSLEIA